MYFMKQIVDFESEDGKQPVKSNQGFLTKLSNVKEVYYLGAITWIPEITEHYDDVVSKVALKNYSLDTLTEENM